MSYRPWKFFVDLFFTITLTVFNVIFHQHFWEIFERDKDRNKLCHHHVIPMVVLSSNKALNQSAHEKLLSYCKIIFCYIIIVVVVVLPLYSFIGEV